MKFDQAMKTTEKDKWMKAVEEEYLRMKKSKVGNLLTRQTYPARPKFLHQLRR
jgi:hypothetical protein